MRRSHTKKTSGIREDEQAEYLQYVLNHLNKIFITSVDVIGVNDENSPEQVTITVSGFQKESPE